MYVVFPNLKDFVLSNFGHYQRQSDFAVTFQVSDHKYQNILATSILANFLHCLRRSKDVLVVL